MARAFDWQSKGEGFDSPNLHNNGNKYIKIESKADYLKSSSNSITSKDKQSITIG